MKIISNAVVLATLLTAGTAVAGEGTPNPMFPTTQGTIQTQDTRTTSAPATQSTNGDAVAIDTSTTGPYSNN
ncbi:hypothetical protein [Arenibaculum pallidiluteum]|uniref:hypothetical protein n=1 Tax=Arenibaculum pallidiluteum TaxID=2812559 RepID=UPI001A9600CE|nr:hypothetical protein [Arenibaculum pallidiluteum]